MFKTFSHALLSIESYQTWSTCSECSLSLSKLDNKCPESKLYAIYKKKNCLSRQKQGRIHSRTVAEGWTGAEMQKPLERSRFRNIWDVLTDLPTDQGEKSHVHNKKLCNYFGS